jgi:NitT/TauT family transport system substrate-binding protein
MGRSLAIALAFVMVTSFVGRVGSVSPEVVRAASPHKALTAVRVGYIPIVDPLPMYSAIEEGYFAKQGIKVDLQPMAGGAVMIPAIQGGSIDMGFSNVLSLLLAASQGLDLVDVAPGDYETRAHPSHGILVPGNSSIHSAADLNGKRVAVNTLNSIDHIAMQEWVSRHGGDPSRIQFSELPFPQMLGPLAHGQIDAANESEPAVTAGVKQLGMRVLGYQFADLQKNTLLASWITSRSWAKNHQKLVKGFAKALLQGNAFDLAHPVKARVYLEKYTQMSHALANQVKLPVLQKVRVADLSYWVRLGTKWHALSKKVNVNKLVWSTAK